eukprot:19664-Heterococcus_DN1.PRE.1
MMLLPLHCIVAVRHLPQQQQQCSGSGCSTLVFRCSSTIAYQRDHGITSEHQKDIYISPLQGDRNYNFHSLHADRGAACCKRASFALHALRVFLPVRPRTKSASAGFVKQAGAVLHCKPSRDAKTACLNERDLQSSSPVQPRRCGLKFPLRFAALSQLSRSAQQALNALGVIGQTQTSGATERCSTTSLAASLASGGRSCLAQSPKVVLLQQCRSWLAWALEPTELQTPLQLYTALQLPGLHAQLALRHCMQSTLTLATGT